MDREHDVLGGYVPVFLEHLADTRARLGLGVDPQVYGDRHIAADALHEGSTDSEEDDFSDWTHAERDALFRGLSVYSRWRPDLIAASVPTRSEWEVWTYLAALEEGAAGLAAGRGGSEDVEMCVDESVSGSDEADEDTDDCAGESDGQFVCEPALEVTQAWIDVEEQMAIWIVREEERLASGEDDGAHDAQEPVDYPPVKRPRSRPVGSGNARAQSSEGGRVDLDKDHRPSSSKARRSVRNASASSIQQVMGCLELPHLLVLDNILREAEEAMQNGGKSREGSEALAKLEDEEKADIGGVEASSLSNRENTPQGARTSWSNLVIDPVLLASSREAAPTRQQQLAWDPSENALVGCAPTQASSSLPEGPSQSTSLGVSSQPPLQLDTAGANQTANVGSDLSQLSPRSRRRIQKRLYMRRKRAIHGGGVVDTGIGRLKPGKKAKSKQIKTPVVSTPLLCKEDPDAKMEPDKNRKKNKGGMTLPYKLKALFSELGVDAAYLRSQGMDLFHLSRLGRLMGLYGGDEDDESDTTRSIDAELVRHLQAGMISFMTDVIHRAIVRREREVRLKQRCQAWRLGDPNLTNSAIEHAVDVIGARYHSHKEYFKSLEGLDSSPSEPSSPEPDDEIDSELVYSVHREAYTPLVRPPSAWKMGPLVSFARTYEREATRSQRGPGAEVDENDLMADETDEEALAAELEEEEEMDVADMQVSATEEKALLNRL